MIKNGAGTSVGSQWLKEYYHLERYTLTHNSYIGTHNSIEFGVKGSMDQVYRRKYAPADNSPLAHLEFSLKYDHINLDFLHALFQKIPHQNIIDFIEASPTGKYRRKIGFLYEFLTGEHLVVNKNITGNYVDLLEKENYITGNSVRNSRWRINDNLLGTAAFSPVIRKSKALAELLDQNIDQKIKELKSEFSPDIFNRAIGYLYNKETRSSYEIEKEQPSVDRTEKFTALLIRAGTQQTSLLLDESRLVQLQNAIVDPRFAASGFRDFQNYIGQSMPGFREMIHYICPPPAILKTLMIGLKETAQKTVGIYPEVRAALIAFGFVFIHPFEDGNGRLHRFLIHDILVHDGAVPQGFIIPVSAHMLSNIKEYDNILEKYSKPLMQRIKYDKKDDSEIEVTNAKEVESYFRYPDLTDQCIYLAETIHATLREDMPNELIFIQRYDEAKKELQHIVDMPDKEINQMIMFLHQNKGIFPKRRRDKFARLTDDEIIRMQEAFRKTFELDS